MSPIFSTFRYDKGKPSSGSFAPVPSLYEKTLFPMKLELGYVDEA